MSQSRWAGTGSGLGLTLPQYSCTGNPPIWMNTPGHFFSSPLCMILWIVRLVLLFWAPKRPLVPI